MMELLPSLLTGIVTGVVTVAGLRTDVQWLKKVAEKHDQRLTTLEGRKV